MRSVGLPTQLSLCVTVAFKPSRAPFLMGVLDSFSDISSAHKVEPGITAHDNSLSRALYALSTSVATAWQLSGTAYLLTYASIASAEHLHLIPRIRGMRWKAPLAAALVAQFIGARMGLHQSLAILSSHDAARRQQDRRAVLQAQAEEQSDRTT